MYIKYRNKGELALCARNAKRQQGPRVPWTDSLIPGAPRYILNEVEIGRQ